MCLWLWGPPHIQPAPTRIPHPNAIDAIQGAPQLDAQLASFRMRSHDASCYVTLRKALRTSGVMLRRLGLRDASLRGDATTCLSYVVTP
jgi:hypothetical protein